MDCRHPLRTKSSWKMHNIIKKLNLREMLLRNNVKTMYSGTETLTILGPSCQTTLKKVTAFRNLDWQ